MKKYCSNYPGRKYAFPAAPPINGEKSIFLYKEKTNFAANNKTMKRILLSTIALAGIAVFSFSSCNKLKDLAKVSLNIENGQGQFDIPAASGIYDIDIVSEDIYINLDSMISGQNKELSAKNIKEVRVKSCKLVLQDGTKDNNFSALESCKLDIKSNAKKDYVTLAQVANNPDSVAYELNLPVNSNLELKDYFLSANTFTYHITGKTRKALTAPLKCKVIVNYSLVAGL